MVTNISKHSNSFASKLHVTGEIRWRVISPTGKGDGNFVLEGAAFFANDKVRVDTLYYNLQ